MRKNHNRLLFVSYHHGLPSLADSVQNHRLLNYLTRKFNIDVLYRSKCRRNQFAEGIGVWSLSMVFFDRLLLKIFSFLRPIISIDALLWCVIAFLKICIRGVKYDAVIITYEPYSIYLLPCLLRKFLRVKVISVLYDPLSDNMFFPKSKLGKFLRLQLEKQIINHSTKIIVNNILVKNTLQQRYKGTDFKLVYLCGNDVLEHNEIKEQPSNKPLKIVHCGNIHGMRNLKCLNDIIIELKKKVININKEVKFIFYGNCSNVERKRVNDYHNDDVVAFVPSIPQSEIPNVLSSADMLLLIDPLEDGNFSFPSKLCEYIQSGKEILAITNKNSPSGCMLRDFGYTFTDGTDIELMVDFIENIILTGNTRHKRNQIDGAVFSPKVISEQFSNIILNSVYAGIEF